MEPPGWHLPCVIGRDLRFSFLSLENVYVREHNVRACSTDLRMMVFRAPLWLVIGAKLWRGGEYGEALAIMLLGETCLLVYAAMRLDYERFVRWEEGGVAAAAAAAVVGGRYRSVLLLGVVLVQAILAHWRTDLAGYLHLHSRLPTKLSNFAMDCVMSRVLHAHGLAPPPASACPAGGPRDAYPAGGPAWAPPPLGSPAAVQLCRDYQLLSQLTLGFMLPLLWVFRRELAQRQLWLQRRGVRTVLLGGTLLDWAAYVLPVVWLAWTVHMLLLLPSSG
eukprot:scaffold2.g7230.t1